MERRIIAETERLYLSPFIIEDFDAMHKILSDPFVMKYYPAPFSEEQTREWITKNLKRYKNDGHGLWAVILKKTETLIGDCGIMNQIVEGEVEKEIGYHLNKNYWGKGYATEAAKCCMDMAQNTFGYKKIISLVRPVNKESENVALRNGLRIEKVVHYGGYEHNKYAFVF